MKLLKLTKRKIDPAGTPNMLARHLFSSYEHYRVDHLGPHNCNHAEISKEVHSLVAQSKGLFRLEELGKSLEGRSINLVSCGKGSKRVLLWSQMHGDEYTATLALMDIFNFVGRRAAEEKWIQEMLEEATLYFIPMLNPDGAERRQRRTVQNIDMNRDAKTLMTPEAKLLRHAQQRLKPQFGFNLHDQDLSTVGDTREVTAIALLAPPIDRKRSTPMVRVRAMRVAALMTRVLSQFIPKNIATYDDAFEPRAFGDNMQMWGTSTVLVESGHWPNDREKNFIRKLNYVGLLTALRCIGNGSYQDAELDLYKELPQNGKTIYDIIIRDVVLVGDRHFAENAKEGDGHLCTVDIGLTIPTNTNPNPLVVTVKDVGDLSTYIALENIVGHKRRISSSFLTLEQSLPLATLLDELQLYHHAKDP
jgi:hypothetical protein